MSDWKNRIRFNHYKSSRARALGRSSVACIVLSVLLSGMAHGVSSSLFATLAAVLYLFAVMVERQQDPEIAAMPKREQWKKLDGFTKLVTALLAILSCRLLSGNGGQSVETGIPAKSEVVAPGKAAEATDSADPTKTARPTKAAAMEVPADTEVPTRTPVPTEIPPTAVPPTEPPTATAVPPTASPRPTAAVQQFVAPPPAAPPPAALPAGCVDINSASFDDLLRIDQVGPDFANQIIQIRQRQRFRTLNDLKRVDGIGDGRLRKIKAQGLACVG